MYTLFPDLDREVEQLRLENAVVKEMHNLNIAKNNSESNAKLQEIMGRLKEKTASEKHLHERKFCRSVKVLKLGNRS